MIVHNMSLNRFLLSLIIAVAAIVGHHSKVKADYWLVIGSYRQGPGSKPHVSGITSPTLFAIPIGTKKMCEEAGNKIDKDIYKPVWQFDNKWTCIKNSSN